MNGYGAPEARAHLLHLVAVLAMILKEWMNLHFQGTIVMCSLTQSRHPSRRGTAIFFTKNTGEYFLGPLTLGGDTHMSSTCNVAVTYASHMVEFKILENTRVLHFTHDQSGLLLEPCPFLCIIARLEGQQLLRLK